MFCHLTKPKKNLPEGFFREESYEITQLWSTR